MSEDTEKRVISFSPPDISELEIAEVAEALSLWVDYHRTAHKNAGVPFGCLYRNW